MVHALDFEALRWHTVATTGDAGKLIHRASSGVATVTDSRGRAFNVIGVGGTICNTSTLTSTVIISRLVNSTCLHSYLLRDDSAAVQPVRLSTSGQTSGVLGTAAAYSPSSNRLLVYGGVTERGYLERFQELFLACNPGFGLLEIGQTHKPCTRCTLDHYWADFEQGCLPCPAGLHRKDQGHFDIQDCSQCLPK